METLNNIQTTFIPYIIHLMMKLPHKVKQEKKRKPIFIYALEELKKVGISYTFIYNFILRIKKYYIKLNALIWKGQSIKRIDILKSETNNDK